MKIAIMTVPFNNNYGGFLQAYALKTVLNNMGHSTIFIMRRHNRPDRYINLKRWIFRRDKHLYYLDDFHLYKISKYTRRFQKKYFYPYTKDYYDSESLNECRNMDIDCFIAGSDQCWRYVYANDIRDFFFNFLKGSGKKRISYAASLGTVELEYDDFMLAKCRELLAEFSAISVREESGAQLLVDKFGIDKDKVKVVLDPTMILKTENYKMLFDKVKKEDHDYIFSYILDDSDDKFDLLKHISKQKNLPILSQKAQGRGCVRKEKIIAPVELWLSRIYNSSFVVTDSFHGCVFSILFNKPFIVYGNPDRGMARFDHLLHLFHLEFRYVDEVHPYNYNMQEINWQTVNQIIEEERDKSLLFLKNAIS